MLLLLNSRLVFYFRLFFLFLYNTAVDLYSVVPALKRHPRGKFMVAAFAVEVRGEVFVVELPLFNAPCSFSAEVAVEF